MHIYWIVKASFYKDIGLDCVTGPDTLSSDYTTNVHWINDICSIFSIFFKKKSTNKKGPDNQGLRQIISYYVIYTLK